MNSRFSIISRVLLGLAAVSLVISIFVPIWRIELIAPQYPEGLMLQMHANKLAGQVDIINGLNHYIGMKTLHTEDFIEFTILPYIIGFFALLSLAVAITGNKKLLFTLLGLFLFFGILSMVDFYRWNYDYGHNLNPDAAIIVPGMAYQPPLIGYKQLLNFAAFSVPDIGGWLFIVSAIFMMIATALETGLIHRIFKKKVHAPALMIALFAFVSCKGVESEPIKLNTDDCEFCKMTITDARFAAELITKKGRVYKFDDLACMVGYVKENAEQLKDARFFVNDFLEPYALTSSDLLIFVSGEKIGSPMQGNLAGFANKDSAEVYRTRLEAVSQQWKDIMPNI